MAIWFAMKTSFCGVALSCVGMVGPILLMRSGWVNISNPSSRATATSVTPAASAVRTASAVGAETATRIGTPIGGRLLHQFDRQPAGQEDDAAAAAYAGPRQRAGQLVEGIVAADVLAQRDDPCRRGQKRGGVDGVGLAVERLARGSAPMAAAISSGVTRQSSPTTGRHRAHRLGQDFDAAEAAAGRPGEMPPPRLRALSARGSASRIRSSMPIALDDDLQRHDLVWRSDDALGQAEADREVLEVARASPSSPRGSQPS